ncbi:hypothetical protein GCM10010317_091500 [Streptomyces mirabilis]|nr:hypothetical protein GCM10010317_091500 [Streptomyces mirabilis]
MTAATAPVSTPQNPTTAHVGSGHPGCEGVPITIEAASTPETKKTATRIITTMLDTVAIGYC